MSGTGKRTALLECLQTIARQRGLPFTIQTKSIQGHTGSSGDGDGEEEASGSGAAATSAEEMSGQITFESSLVHTGFDVARMSMQDKQVLRPVFTNLGQGSQVLAGDQGRGCRILVLYHAHLLSSESVLLLQACLEQNEGDVSVWLTSELPVPIRVRDWFVEIPIAGEDRSFQAYTRNVSSYTPFVANWNDVFMALVTKWLHSPAPTIEDVKGVKGIVYELLMRNLRWVEAVHFLLDVCIQHEELTEEQRFKCVNVLAGCEATAGGYTIPSYRIPILWESVFLQLRSILTQSDHKKSKAM